MPAVLVTRSIALAGIFFGALLLVVLREAIYVPLAMFVIVGTFIPATIAEAARTRSSKWARAVLGVAVLMSVGMLLMGVALAMSVFNPLAT